MVSQPLHSTLSVVVRASGRPLAGTPPSTAASATWTTASMPPPSTATRVTVTFYGSAISYYTEANSDEGDIGVSLDGVSQGTVDAYAAARSAQRVLYSASGLTPGLHTLTLTKDSGAYLLADRFDIS